jgi:hypothetical protein
MSHERVCHRMLRASKGIFSQHSTQHSSNLFSPPAPVFVQMRTVQSAAAVANSVPAAFQSTADTFLPSLPSTERWRRMIGSASYRTA